MPIDLPMPVFAAWVGRGKKIHAANPIVGTLRGAGVRNDSWEFAEPRMGVTCQKCVHVLICDSERVRLVGMESKMHPKVKEILDTHKQNKQDEYEKALAREQDKIAGIKTLLPEWTHEFVVGSVSFINYDALGHGVYLRLPECMDIRLVFALKSDKSKYIRFDVQDDWRMSNAQAIVKFSLEDAVVLAEQRWRERASQK